MNPFFWFALISTVFALGVWPTMDAHQYWLAHLFFGGVFPLLAGYLRFAVDREKLWDWRIGVAATLVVSVANEVVVDPLENGIPFVHAWHHMAADIAGAALFSAFFLWWKRRGLNSGNGGRDERIEHSGM